MFFTVGLDGFRYSLSNVLNGRYPTAAERSGAVVLITADHGGVGKKHGGESMDELEIPWIISGPGVRTGEIKGPVNQFDTAATVAYLLGLQTAPCWIGRTISEAFRPRAAVRGLPEPGHQAPRSTIRMK